MPMYDYRCDNCGKKFEELVWNSSTSDAEIICPHCGENKSKRLLSAPSVAVGSNSASCPQSRDCSSSGFS